MADYERALSAILPAGIDPAALPYLASAANPGLDREGRLGALRAMLGDLPAQAPGGAEAPRLTGETNNHIHTIYSFSPYTPSMAAWRSRAAGLSLAGSVDHDSMGAAREMLDACAILGIGGTVGFELRVSCLDSPFASAKLNNPDSTGIAYMTVQGVPRQAFDAVAEFLWPVHRARGERNRVMSRAASEILSAAGYDSFDYDRDVLPLSQAAEGGSLTERHILAAVAGSILRRHGPGPELVSGLESELGLKPTDRLRALLSDTANPHLLYDLLGFLKSGFLDRIFIQPGPEECPPVSLVTGFARSIGAIPAYAYLGDVGQSPTGDKKAERFEDGYLDELVAWLPGAGFKALTYMPPRNSPEQLARLRGLCERHGLLEISGVDINSSRQSFSSPGALSPAMSRLLDSSWALLAHERLSGLDQELDFFSEHGPLAALPLPERVERYAAVGRMIDPVHPDDADTLARLIRNWRR